MIGTKLQFISIYIYKRLASIQAAFGEQLKMLIPLTSGQLSPDVVSNSQTSHLNHWCKKETLTYWKAIIEQEFDVKGISLTEAINTWLLYFPLADIRHLSLNTHIYSQLYLHTHISIHTFTCTISVHSLYQSKGNNNGALWFESAVLTAFTLDLLKCNVAVTLHTHTETHKYCRSQACTTINLTPNLHSFHLLKWRKTARRARDTLVSLIWPSTLTSGL